MKAQPLVRLTNDLGALCPQFDRPEQGLDLLQEAITSLGLVPGQDISLAINCAGHEILDYVRTYHSILCCQDKHLNMFFCYCHRLPLKWSLNSSQAAIMIDRNAKFDRLSICKYIVANITNITISPSSR